MTSRIQGIDSLGKDVSEASPPTWVTVRLEEDIDVSRGGMIARLNNAPTVADIGAI